MKRPDGNPTARKAIVAMLVSELLELVRQNLALNGCSSVKTFPSQAKPVRLAIGDRAASEITYLDLEAYKAKRKELGLANATINLELQLLMRGFRLWRRSDPDVRVPVCDMLSVNNERHQFVDEVEMEKIVARLKRLYRRDFVRFAFYTGKRPGSIRQLAWDDVDLEKATVRFRAETIKTRQYEVFPIYRQVREILEGRQETRCGDLVFHRGDGEPVRAFSQEMRLAAAEAGLAGIQVRDMRSSFVTHCALQEIPLKTTMRLSGHRSLRMAVRYHKVADREMRQAAETLERAFGA